VRNRYLQDNLFRVDTHHDSGVAFFVGRRAGELWLATPAHVVFEATYPNHFDGEARPGLSVRSLSGETMQPCTGYPPSNWVEPYDLTFLCVTADRNTFVHDEVLADRMDLDARYVLFGKSSSLSSMTVGAKIEPLPSPDDITGARHRLIDIAPQSGDSGALLANCRGVVGMFLNSQRQFIDFETIAAQAAQAQVPWTISRTEYFAPNESVSVCPEFEQGSARRVELVPLGGGTAIPLEGCGDVPHAKYSVRPSDPAFVCSPRHLIVSTRSLPPVLVKLRCAVGLNGTWTSSEAGDLSCVESSPGHAQCFGWLNLQSGMFTGHAMSVGEQHVRFRGQFSTPTHSEPITGDFRWNDGRLSGTLVFGIVRRELSLRRAP